MAIPDVIELYDQVPVGTPIYMAAETAANVVWRRPRSGALLTYRGGFVRGQAWARQRRS